MNSLLLLFINLVKLIVLALQVLMHNTFNMTSSKVDSLVGVVTFNQFGELDGSHASSLNA